MIWISDEWKDYEVLVLTTILSIRKTTHTLHSLTMQLTSVKKK